MQFVHYLKKLSEKFQILNIRLNYLHYSILINLIYQLQEFLQTYIKPWYAINMDGGGSTGMLIKDKGVVNYPCNGVSDNTFAEYEGSITERPLITYFAIRER